MCQELTLAAPGAVSGIHLVMDRNGCIAGVEFDCVFPTLRLLPPFQHHSSTVSGMEAADKWFGQFI